MNFFFTFLALLQIIVSAPVPQVVTRLHTAPAVTTTQTYITGTTTIWLPPVEIFISNGVRYTFTKYDGQWATTQATSTSTYTDDNAVITTSSAGQTEATPTTETEEFQPPVTTSASPTTQQPSSTATPTTATPTSTATPTTATPTTATPTTTPAPTSSLTTAETTPATTEAPSTSEIVPETTTSTSSSETTTSTLATTTPQTTSETTTSTPEETPTTTTSTSSTSTTSTTSSTSTTPAPTAAPSGSIRAPSVIVYSPYENSGACKSYEAIEGDLQLIKSKGINKLRIYGVDCLVTQAVLPLCVKYGFTVNQGFWISQAGVNSIDAHVSQIVSWAQTNGWGVFDYFTVGNEVINEKWVTVLDLINKIASVKSILNNAGYSGPITTAEPPVSYVNNPSLCTDSVIDFVGVNPHSYFNENLYAYQAGEYITMQQGQIAKLCSKKAVITETGYPHKGDAYGNNVPSPENQYLALKSIMDYTGGDVTILTPFDDMWKHPGPHNIEQYFGMINLVQ